jgi:Fe-S-cluster containining protein
MVHYSLPYQFDKFSSTDLSNGHPINLAKNTNLHSLTLHCGTCCSTYFNDVDGGLIYNSEYQRPISWALSLLSQIALPQVSEFKLRMVMGGPVLLSCVDWSLLDEILSRCHGLKQVVVDII